MQPFDLQIALKHPNWVRHEDGTQAVGVEYRPEVGRRYQVRIEWSDGGVGTYLEDSELIGMEYPKTCRWTTYDTECGNSYGFLEGTPSDNGFKFCPFCGKEIST